MVAVEGIADWIGRDVVDRSGEKVGKLEDVYYDTADDEPTFIAVKSGAFGRTHSVAPLLGATLSRDFVRLDAPKGLIKDAPSEDAGGRLTGVDALAVLKHFGLPRQEDLDGEERVCFQTTGAAEETERKRAEAAAEEARVAAGASAAARAHDMNAVTGVAEPAGAAGAEDDAPASSRPGGAVTAPEDEESAPAAPEPALGSTAIAPEPAAPAAAAPAPEPERDLPAGPAAAETAEPGAAAPASVVPVAAAPASVVPPEDLAPADDDPLARLAALERRVSALEARR